jgi:3-hydroxyacyl-[acyl-carrier-protein] dehydratase
MDVATIHSILPQRHPLLLVDRVLAFESGKRIEAVKAITASEPCYAAVPDGAPLSAYAYPASLLIESFGQSVALLWLAQEPEPPGGSVLLFAGARDFRLEHDVYPGDVVRHVAVLERVVAQTAFASGESWVGDRRVAHVGSLFAARRSWETAGIPT